MNDLISKADVQPPSSRACAQIIAVFEHDRSAPLEFQHGVEMCAHRSERTLLDGLRLGTAQPFCLGERQADRHIAHQRLGRCLVGDDVGEEVAPHELGEHLGAIADQADRQSLPLRLRGQAHRDGLLEIGREMLAIAGLDTAADLLRVDVHHQNGGAGKPAGERLRAAHAAAAAGDDQAAAERAAEMRARAGHEGFVGALQDALAADVLPRGGGHAGIDGQTLRAQPLEMLVGRPAPDQVAVRHHHQRPVGAGAENADRLAGLHDQRFAGVEPHQRVDGQAEALPVACGLGDRHVDNKRVLILGVFEIIFEQAQNCFLPPSLAAQMRPARRDNAIVYAHTSAPMPRYLSMKPGSLRLSWPLA